MFCRLCTAERGISCDWLVGLSWLSTSLLDGKQDACASTILSPTTLSSLGINKRTKNISFGRQGWTKLLKRRSELIKATGSIA